MSTTRKTECPITRSQFDAKASTALPTVSIAGQGVSVQPRQFTTGSMGFYGNGKVQVMIDGVPCWCQVSANVTVIGSKELPAKPTVEAA